MGRSAELARIADVMAQVEAGQPWLVAIEGEPGVGKTSLARQGLSRSRGVAVRVLTARADPAEADLDFGLIDQLLRAAGSAQLLMPADGSGSPVSSFAVGARLLETVGQELAAGPVAILVDDLQWADRKSVEALTFMLRRLSVDPVLAIVTYRGAAGGLDEAGHRLLSSVDNRLHLPLKGLSADEVAPLAAALSTEALDEEAAQRLYHDTGGHPLYLRTLLSEGSGFDPRVPGGSALPRSLAAAIGDQLNGLAPETRSIVEMLAVLDLRMPLAQLGQAAQRGSPSAAIEQAVDGGLVQWWPDEPTCPVQIRHPLVRDAIYSGITAGSRRLLHARAAVIVGEAASWKHRVAALERPDENLAAQLEQLATAEAAAGRQALAATHLQWASDISPGRADRERRLLTAALHLALAEESPEGALRQAVEGASPSPLRDCVLGTMAYSCGQLAEAERRFGQALARAQGDPGSQPLAALIANHLAGTYSLMGDGARALAFGRQALDSGLLDPAVASQTRNLIAMGTSQLSGPQAGLAELTHLEADPAQVQAIDVDGLSYRGLLWMLTGDPGRGIRDLAGSLALARRGATLTLGVRAYFWLAQAQYLAGAWDDALLTAEQGFSAAAIHPRRFELPLLHLAASCVAAGRGATEEAERHARLAEAAASSVDYGQEKLFAAMARALVCQAAGDYPGIAAALDTWRDGTAQDGRSQLYAVIWRPILAEGLIGSGQLEAATAVVAKLRADSGQIAYLTPVLAWLEGWLAEQSGDPEQALQIYQRGEQTAGPASPVHTGRLLLSHGRLLRRTGQRRAAAERLQQASLEFQALRAAPFMAQTDEELVACRLPKSPSRDRTALTLTSRETEVAHLVGKGLSNPEIAAELFISRKAVEYHLGNIYAKCGLQGRQQLRRFVEQWAQPRVA